MQKEQKIFDECYLLFNKLGSKYFFLKLDSDIDYIKLEKNIKNLFILLKIKELKFRYTYENFVIIYENYDNDINNILNNNGIYGILSIYGTIYCYLWGIFQRQKKKFKKIHRKRQFCRLIIRSNNKDNNINELQQFFSKYIGLKKFIGTNIIKFVK